MDQSTRPIIIETVVTPEYVCLLLHGGGGNPGEFKALIPAISPPGIGIRYVIPYAPEIKLTLFGGHPMRAWYDVVDANLELRQDIPGIQASTQAVLSIIATEHSHGIPYEKIVVGGFSQGGAIALFAALQLRARLAGAFCLSGYLLEGATPPKLACSENRGTPIYIGHGIHDERVPVHLAECASSTLRCLGFTVDANLYSMDHQVCEEELQSLRDWLRRVCNQNQIT